MKRVLGIVPARGGSKGVPAKNRRLLNGRPLIEYTAAAALGATTLARVVLSTDDEEIAAVGQRCGLDVPFMRPAALATDATPTLPVVEHALAMLEAAGDRFDAVCILQPTTPLRRSVVIDRCVEQLWTSNADAVVTVVPVPVECNPHWVYFRSDDGCMRLSTGEAVPIPRRQDLPPAYRREGSVYVTRRSVVERGTLFGDRLVGCPVNPAECVDINTEDDWQRAEEMLRARADQFGNHDHVRLSSSNR
jgi:CMP-N-acetylneuraminic acid synthetase